MQASAKVSPEQVRPAAPEQADLVDLLIAVNARHSLLCSLALAAPLFFILGFSIALRF